MAKQQMTTSDACEALARLDAEAAWVVGGSIRDALAGIEHGRFDIDIAVAGADIWARAAGDALDAPAISISAEFGVWRIPLAGGQIDVWNLPDDDIERDLRRRDFTVNAMAVPLDRFRRGDLPESVVDPFDARRDLADRRLRLVSDGALQEDPLRMLRAVLLEAEGGWRPDAALRAAIRRDAELITRSSAERQWDELRRIVLSDRLPWALRRMERSGLLDIIFPELAHCRAVAQRPVHRRDVFWHQIDAVRWLTRLTDQSPPRGDRAGAIRQALAPLLGVEGIRRSLDQWRLPLRLATLLHDIGKPDTRTVDEQGSTHFFGHSELGAGLAAQRLRRLRAPGQTVKQVELLIEQHLRPGQINAPGQPPTERALHRFHAALGDAATPLCWLFLADSLATVGAELLLPRWSAYAAHVARIVSWEPRRPAQTDALLNGHAIMDVTGLSPGPQVGEIRAKIDEAAAIGDVTSVEQARRMALELAEAMRDAPVA